MNARMAGPAPLDASGVEEGVREHAGTDDDEAEAIAAVLSHPGEVIVDLDETLYLHNSTEDFLDLARPRAAAAILLRLLDVLKPWRMTGGVATRDVWRVRVVMIVLPWIATSWRRRVAELAAHRRNAPLCDALIRRSPPFVVATDGFEPIVRPLVAALGFHDARVVACAPTPADRLRGKLARTREAIGRETIASALVLTDSDADRPLLDACERPILLRWRDARYQRALSDAYLPGDYITRVKHPGESFLRRGILLEDFSLWVLAAAGATSHPLQDLAGMTLLLLSFWTIYELGYADNDRVGERFEKDPVLSRQYFEKAIPTPTLSPWLWAAAFGAAGVLFLHGPHTTAWSAFLRWMAVLGATWALFFVYNRFDKRTRIWLYPGLQAARAFSFVALVAVTPVGAAALAAHVLGRWFPYAVYRAGAKDWPRMPVALVRFVFFAVLFATLAVGGLALHQLFSWSSLALIVWIAYRARREFVAVWHQARWLPG